VVKLAAGTDSITTSLAVWPEPERGLHIWGLITSESQAVGSAPLHGHPTFLLHAPFLVVRARAPGVLYVYYRRQLHLLYVRGTAHFLLSSGRLQEILRDDAHLQPLDANALSQIATRISLLGHGGTLLLTAPETEVSTDLLDISYSFDPPSPVLRDAVRAPMANLDDRPAERHALDFVAQLSQVDGAVHLTSDLVLRGFGGKIKSSAEVKLMTRDIGSQDARPISDTRGSADYRRTLVAVLMARTLAEGLHAVEDPALSAAILDHALSDGDTSEICQRMKERNIPFVTYSGYDDLVGVCREGVHVNKPASMSVLVATVQGLLAEPAAARMSLPTQ
jgi:CheY-like chemotaxis protein